MAANPEFKVVTKELRAEAKIWQQRSDEFVKIMLAAQHAVLTQSAFAVVDFNLLGVVNAKVQAAEYDTYRNFMENLLRGAIHEFGQIAGALRTMADEYDRTEDTNKLEFDKFYRARS